MYKIFNIHKTNSKMKSDQICENIQNFYIQPKEKMIFFTYCIFKSATNRIVKKKKK